MPALRRQRPPRLPRPQPNGAFASLVFSISHTQEWFKLMNRKRVRGRTQPPEKQRSYTTSIPGRWPYPLFAKPQSHKPPPVRGPEPRKFSPTELSNMTSVPDPARRRWTCTLREGKGRTSNRRATSTYQRPRTGRAIAAVADGRVLPNQTGQAFGSPRRLQAIVSI